MSHREILARHGFDVRLDNDKGEFVATRGKVSFMALIENGTLELYLNGPGKAEENAMSVKESAEVLTAYMEAGSAHSELLRIGTDEEDDDEDMSDPLYSLEV